MLTKSNEIDVEGEEQWKMLIKFLEKEARVHQQRTLIQQTNFKATARKEDQIDSNRHRYNQMVHLANGNVEKYVHFVERVMFLQQNQTKLKSFNTFPAERLLR